MIMKQWYKNVCYVICHISGEYKIQPSNVSMHVEIHGVVKINQSRTLSNVFRK